jgi:hypothetical protein
MTKNRHKDSIRKLEDLRREVGRAGRRQGELHDYLERGKPGSKEKQETWKEIDALKKTRSRARERLLEYHDELSDDQADTLRKWYDLHITTCLTLIDETPAGHPPGSFEQVRRAEADETRKAWKRCREGKGGIPIDINSYFLRDYNECFDNLLNDTENP